MSKSWKPRTGQTIDAIYAWVVTEPDGGEGVAGALMGTLLQMPLVSADMDRMKSLRFFAENIHRSTGYPVRLVRFGSRDDLEIL